jgi:hypothetical protein
MSAGSTRSWLDKSVLSTRPVLEGRSTTRIGGGQRLREDLALWALATAEPLPLCFLPPPSPFKPTALCGVIQRVSESSATEPPATDFAEFLRVLFVFKRYHARLDNPGADHVPNYHDVMDAAAFIGVDPAACGTDHLSMMLG